MCSKCLMCLITRNRTTLLSCWKCLQWKERRRAGKVCQIALLPSFLLSWNGSLVRPRSLARARIPCCSFTLCSGDHIIKFNWMRKLLHSHIFAATYCWDTVVKSLSLCVFGCIKDCQSAQRVDRPGKRQTSPFPPCTTDSSFNSLLLNTLLISQTKHP